MEAINLDSNTNFTALRESKFGENFAGMSDAEIVNAYRSKYGVGSLVSDVDVVNRINAQFSRSEPSLRDKLINSRNSVEQGIARTLAGIPKMFPILARRITQNMSPEAQRFWLGGDHDIEDSALFKLGEFIENQIEEAYPTNPRLQDDFVFNTLPQGVGSMAGFIATNILSGGTATALTGVGSQVSGSFDEGIARGATEEQAVQAATNPINIAGGAAEAVPVGRVLKRATGALGGGRLISGLIGASEEALQETGQTIASNLAAIQAYDPDRRVSEGIAASAGTGGIIGFMTNVAAAAMGAKLRGGNIVTRENGTQVAVIDESEANMDRVVEVAAAMSDNMEYQIIKEDGTTVEGKGSEGLLQDFTKTPETEASPAPQVEGQESTTPSEEAAPVQEQAAPAETVSDNIDFEGSQETVFSKAKNFLNSFKEDPSQFSVTNFDKFKSAFADDKHLAVKAYRFMRGEGASDFDSSHFETMLRLLSGQGSVAHRAITDGIIDPSASRNGGQISYFADEQTGDQINLDYFTSAFDTSTEESIETERRLALEMMVAERSEGLGKQGIDTGFTDAQIAGTKARLAEMQESNPEQYARIQEGARRYREFAKAGLKLLVSSGRMSESQYEGIVANQNEYVALRRVMDEQDGSSYNFTEGKPGGALGKSTNPIKKLKGKSRRRVRDPVDGLLDFINRASYEAKRNETMLSFADAIDATQEGDGALGRKVKAPGRQTVSVFRDGEEQHYQIDDKDLYDALTKIESVSQEMGWIMDILSVPATAIRATVTNAPPFAIRNYMRDFVNRLIISRNSPSLKDYKRSDRKWARERIKALGGDQFGYYLGDRASYKALQQEAMHKLAKSKHTALLHPFKLGRTAFNKYQDALKNSEMFSREAEFIAAHRKAMENGLNDYEASIYAAAQARELLDFAVAGSWMRYINRVVPFSNAAVQGLRRTMKAGKENPAGFTAKMMIYSALPSIMARVMAHSLGYEDEYEQLPDYQRDLFWNFKVHPDLWVTIPKPFELGAMGSFFERSFSEHAYGEERAMDGYTESLLRSVMPVDESAMALGFRTPIEIMANYDFFRGKRIVPKYDEDKHPSLRTTHGMSRIARALHGQYGIKDGRQVDHFMKSSFSYFGGWALKASNIGQEDGDHFGIADTGIFKNTPVYGAKDVQWILDAASEFNMKNTEEYKQFNELLGMYFDAEGEERIARSKDVLTVAGRIRDYWEQKDLLGEALAKKRKRDAEN